MKLSVLADHFFNENATDICWELMVEERGWI